MHNYLITMLRKRYVLLLLFFFALAAPKLTAQSLAISWDTETGCQLYETDGPRKFLADIQDGPCLRVCQNQFVTYTLIGDTSTVLSSTWVVTGGNVFSSDNLSCAVEWGNYGAANIQVTITFADNTVHTYNMCIEKIQGPKAEFTILDASQQPNFYACDNQDVYFTNLSNDNGSSPIVEYYWNFGDGTTSSAQNPVHSFLSGSYNVVLTVTNNCGCSNMYMTKVYIGKDGVEIYCPSVVCEGEVAQYFVSVSNSDTRCNGTEWSVSGGTIVSPMPNGISVEWNSVDDLGFGYVSFDTTSCDVPCPSIATIKVPVVQTVGSIKGPQYICGKKQYIYNLPKWPATEFNWELVGNPPGASLINNDQRNEIILDLTDAHGVITLHCTYFNTLLHCGGNATLLIHIVPQTYIEGAKFLCENDSETYTLNSESSPVDANWVLTGPNGIEEEFWKSSFTPTFDGPGVYTLTVDPGNNYCSAEPIYITVREAPPAPESILGETQICPSVTNIYSINNTVPDTDISWQVTGGAILGSSFGDEISVVFNATGPYSVSAKRVGKKNPHCESTLTVLNIILLNPDLEITSTEPFNPICGSTSANYTVEEVGLSAYTGAETYSWTIDPVTAGSVVTGQNTNTVEILWNQPTTPFATLSVEVKECGLTFNASQQIVVVSIPPITINAPTTACAGEEVNFSLTGYTSGNITWDFGSGVYSNDDNPSYAFPQNTTSNTVYNVSVTIEHPNGCLLTFQQTVAVTVLPAPAATLSLMLPSGQFTICEEANIPPMILTLLGGLGNTTQIDWYGPSGFISTSYPIDLDFGEFQATAFGSYYAILTYAPNGCTETTDIITIISNCETGPGPGCPIAGNPDFTLTQSNTDCLEITLGASFSGMPSSPTNFSWVYPPVFTAVGPLTINTAVIEAQHPGVFYVKYDAYYPKEGAPTEFCLKSKSIQVIVPYKANLLYEIKCGTTPGKYDVTLYDNSEYLATITPITHDFYEGSASNPPLNGSIQGYSWDVLDLLPGSTHTFILKIDHAGYPACYSEIEITLPPYPSADFTFTNSPACPGEPISFSALDTTPGLTYLWNFDDGATNLLPNPERSYTAQGPQNVILTVTNQYGCSVTNNEAVMVNLFNSMDGEHLPANGQICEGDSILLSYSNITTYFPTSYQWMNGTEPISGANASTYSAEENGSYWLVVADSNGCDEKLNANPAIVNIIPSPGIDIEGPSSVCLGEQFSLSAYTGDPNVSLSWSLDSVPQSAWDDLTEITTSFDAAGTYVFSLETIISGSSGTCSAVTTHSVTVLPVPSEPTVTYTVDCDGYLVKLDVVSPDPTGYYNWSTGDSGTTGYSWNGGPIQLRYTDSAGCSITTEVDVPRNPENYIWVFPNGCYEFCKGYEQQLHTLIGPALGADIENWKWYKTGGVATAGVIEVDDYTLPGLGSFALWYDNGICDIMSKPLVLTEYDCIDCELKVSPRGTIKVVEDKDYKICHYEFSLYFENPSGVPLYVTISNKDGLGVLSPSTVLVPPTAPGLPVAFDFLFYPIAPFAGGMVSFTFNGESEDHKTLCQQKYEIEFPELDCKPEQGITKGPEQTTGNLKVRNGLLQLVPNPAKNATEIRYVYKNEIGDTQRKIEIYDIIGRPILNFDLKDASGTINVDLSGFPAGYYLILLKENGELLQQQKLIVQ